jgi:hypothetical protein
MSPPTPSAGEQVGAGAVETTYPITVTVATEAAQGMERTPNPNPKLESSLNQLLRAYQEDGPAAAQAFAQAHQIALEDGRVQVVIVTRAEALPDVKEAVDGLGGDYESHYENLLQALVPLEALEALAQRPDVKLVREPRRAMP